MSIPSQGDFHQNPFKYNFSISNHVPLLNYGSKPFPTTYRRCPGPFGALNRHNRWRNSDNKLECYNVYLRLPVIFFHINCLLYQKTCIFYPLLMSIHEKLKFLFYDLKLVFTNLSAFWHIKKQFFLFCSHVSFFFSTFSSLAFYSSVELKSSCFQNQPRCKIYWNLSPISNLLLSYLPPPPLGQDMTQGQFFKRSLTGLNSEFSFS